MEICIRVCIRMENLVDLASITGPMAVTSKVFSRTAFAMDKAYGNAAPEIATNTKANTLMTKKTATEFSHGPQETCTKVHTNQT